MIKQAKGTLRIGTSGIVVPGSKESYPGEFKLKSRLSYYSSLFNTLEVNSTFHKMPRHSTVEKWSSEAPEEFQFTIKLWKETTHVKKLNTDLDNIDLSFEAANHIGNKKGCLLVQFPGSITIEYIMQVEQILLRLHQLDEENLWRKAIEFRSVTWYDEQTYMLLKKFGDSMVLQDMPKSKNLELNEAGSFVYYRFHGPKGDYRGSYADDFLEQQAEKIRARLNEGKDVYAYFNNTMGSAFDNARSLRGMVERKG